MFTGVSPRQDTNTARMFTYAGYVSYVTGAHNFKTGVQVRTGWSQELFETRGDIVQIVSNGEPQSVRLVNNPSGHKESGVNTGIYLQDSWTLGRVTINPGLRYERFVMSIPAQSAGAGTWVPAREFAEQKNIVNWNTLSPRFGFAWDLFGDGRTAIKGGLSRYDRLAGVTIVQPLNQRNIAFQTCPWSDTNDDLRAQNDEIAVARCTGSLQPSLGFVDPNLKRPHQWEYTAMVQRQIGGRTSVMVGYYGRRFWDLYTTVNDAVPSTAYTPVTITQSADQSADDRLQPGSGDARAGAERAQDDSGSAADLQRRRVPDQHAHDAGDVLRRPHHWQERGRSGRRRSEQSRTCASTTRAPSGSTRPIRSAAASATCCRRASSSSGSIRESSGLPQTRTYVVTTTQVPGLTQVTQNVQVAERGEFRYPWVNLVDLRIAKVVSLGRHALRADAGRLQHLQQQRGDQCRPDRRLVARPAVGDRDGPSGACRRAFRRSEEVRSSVSLTLAARRCHRF